MIVDERCLKIDIYEYMNAQLKIHPIRMVGLITDKQAVLYSQLLKNDHDTHDTMVDKINKDLYPKNTSLSMEELNKSNVFIASFGKEFAVYLPEDGILSENQVLMLNEKLDQLKRYNEQPGLNENDIRKVLILGNVNNQNISIRTTDIDKIKEILESEIKDVYRQRYEESIIGKPIEDFKELENNHIL